MNPASRNVLTGVTGRLGRLTLNRPERINALSLSMITTVFRTLQAWLVDPQVEVVLIDGAGPRGLCAGGDIREVYEGIHGGDVPPSSFWAQEYEMNGLIAHYPKPVVSVMDGIVFGGGVGISAHAAVRIVTERSQVAMPETAIGLSPDVGALHLLARSPGRLGIHCALTGHRMNGPEAIHAGLADHLVNSADLAALAVELQSGVVPNFRPAVLSAHPAWMDTCYSADSVEEIRDRLRADSAPAARAAADVISAMAPTALKVTLEAVGRAAEMTLDEVFDQDLRVSSKFSRHHDFDEGIRAMVIDKDRAPRWIPPGLDEVSRADVLSYFV